MRIAQLAPTYERVPPATYGGTELVVHLLTEELVRRGHDVTLFASADSQTRGRLHAITPRAVRYGESGTLRHPEYVQLANAQACFLEAARGSFDIVHNHAGIEGLALAAASATPVLTTTHLDWAEETRPIWDAYPWAHHQVSGAQARSFPVRGQLPAVHHGIDVSSIRPRTTGAGEGHLLFLGRFTSVKGPHLAIDAARRAGRRILLAGKVDTADMPWFEREVHPRIDGDRVVLVGEVGGEQKAELLADASALLFPISWEEPFGLVIVEAMASGTPVIAFPRGSAPELIDEGSTGFLVRDPAAMADAILRVAELDRAAVRHAAEQRFTVERMTDDVLDRYAETLRMTPPARPLEVATSY